MGFLGTYLIMECDHCGTKYGASPEKLTRKEIRFKCKRCKNIVTATRPDSLPMAAEAVTDDDVMLPDWIQEVGEENGNQSAPVGMNSLPDWVQKVSD